MRLVASAVAGLITLTIGIATLALADGGHDTDPPENTAACARVTANARYEGYGYTHVVELKNACTNTVHCQVWTDVDPDRHDLTAKPGETVRTVTRRGSPSRAVDAQSQCKAVP